MDFLDDVSAIDDSYEPIHFHSAGSPTTGIAGPPLTQENLCYNGPRSGNWTVGDIVLGSAIDDGCPTVHPAAEYSASGATQPLAGSVIKRLVEATEDQRKAENARKEADDAQPAAGGDAKQAQGQETELPKLPKGLIIPKFETRGIRIMSKSGKNEIIRQPRIILPVPKPVEKKDPCADKPNEKKTAAPVPQSPLKTDKPASIVSRASQQSKRAVRIVSKSGEEVLMEIPIVSFGSRPASRAASVAKDEEWKGDKQQNGTETTAEKAKRNANAAKIAKQLREEREQEAQIEEQREKNAKIAANAMMSGALPAMSNAPVGGKKSSSRSANSSNKNSAVPFGGLFDNESKAPSAASSKTSVQVSQREASVKLGPQVSKKVQSPPPKELSRVGWGSDGHGVYDPAQQNADRRTTSVHSRRSSVATFVHSIRNGTGFEEIRSGNTPRDLSHHSNQPQNNSRDSLDRPATIYAGRGWISPHPLSEPPSEYRRSPDPEIKIPSRDGEQEGATMTFTEWKDIQQREEVQSIRDVRRNYSRSSSGAGRYAAGSWGYRNWEAAESVHDSVHSRVLEGYQSPAVETVRSEATYEHDLDGVREFEGFVQLPMPWDKQPFW